MQARFLAAAAICLALAQAPCRAPADTPPHSSFLPTLEIDSDLQSRLPSVGRPYLAMNLFTFRTAAELGSGWRAEAYGVKQYGDYLLEQATVETDWKLNRFQAGTVRVPFGIYDTRETYASGIIDYPLVRNDYELHSVDWGAPGAVYTGVFGAGQVEAAAFDGRAAGVWGTSNNIGGATVRAQGYVKSLIVGVSRWDGFEDVNFYGPSHAPVHETGIDIRYTQPHLVVRGEYLFGDLAGSANHGGYLDFYYHLPGLVRWTATARVEGYRPDSDAGFAKQLTLGARYTASADWILTVNWRKNNLDDAYEYGWTPPAQRHGDLVFQVYRKVRL